MSDTRASHLLSIDDLGVDDICGLLELGDRFAEVASRAVPKVPALRGKTVALAFFEDSTRTRLSFDLAAKQLSADVLTFSASGSSLSKGESLRDTAETIRAMGVDAVVIRHRNAGAPAQVAAWLGRSWRQPASRETRDQISVVNAGDGAHQHPTQALGDAYTLAKHRQAHGLADKAAQPSAESWRLDGVHVGIIGDVLFSRVARSAIGVYLKLGATVTLVAPPTLLPVDLSVWPGVGVSHRLDDVIDTLDVVSLLRMQRERADRNVFGSVREYVDRYGLTPARAAGLKPEAVVMHPGPVNRGVELASGVLDGCPNVLVSQQVQHGVAVRAGLLYSLLGATTTEASDG